MPELLLRGDPIGSIRGVLFDKDGTISNSEQYLLRLAKLRIKEASRLFKNLDKNETTINMLEKFLSSAYGLSEKGLSPSGLLAIASKEHNIISTATVLCILGENWPSAISLANQIFLSIDNLEKNEASSLEKRDLLPGVLRVLENFQKAGVVCAVISNDSQNGIKKFLRTNNLEEKITAFWSADHNPAKPNPKAVKELCRNLDLQPSECALIGDSDSDLKMARQAGIGITIGYTAGWTNETYLTEHEHLIQNWDEVNIQKPLFP